MMVKELSEMLDNHDIKHDKLSHRRAYTAD